MRRFVSLFFVTLFFVATAQDYPAEWQKYVGGRYLSDIQQGYNDRGMTEEAYKNYLADIARGNLARQLEIKVNDFATTSRHSVNGDVSINYESQLEISTQIKLKHVKTQMTYNSYTREGFAIAYIDKSAAARAYKNDIDLIIADVEKSLANARNYKNNGLKTQAKGELYEALPTLKQTDDLFFALTFFDESTNYRYLLNKCSNLEQSIKKLLTELDHAIVICVQCKADKYGVVYKNLGNEVKGVLSARGCSFTTDPTKADYVIKINASARKHAHSTFGSTTTYFAYVDASISITNKKSQRIYEDVISVKGGSINYELAANDAYKKVSKQIGGAVSENIEL